MLPAASPACTVRFVNPGEQQDRAQLPHAQQPQPCPPTTPASPTTSHPPAHVQMFPAGTLRARQLLPSQGQLLEGAPKSHPMSPRGCSRTQSSAHREGDPGSRGQFRCQRCLQLLSAPWACSKMCAWGPRRQAYTICLWQPSKRNILPFHPAI